MVESVEEEMMMDEIPSPVIEEVLNESGIQAEFQEAEPSSPPVKGNGGIHHDQDDHVEGTQKQVMSAQDAESPVYVSCWSCGAKATGKFCSECGSNLKEKKCGKCGHLNTPNSKFCNDCGNKLEKPGSSSGPQLFPMQTPPRNGGSSSQPTPRGSTLQPVPPGLPTVGFKRKVPKSEEAQDIQSEGRSPQEFLERGSEEEPWWGSDVIQT